MIGCLVLLLAAAPAVIMGGVASKGKSFREIQSSLGEGYALCRARHDIGAIEMWVGNNGMLDTAAANAIGPYCFTGIHGAPYTRNYVAWYRHWGAFWIGAVVNKDTLVSTGFDGWYHLSNEFLPDNEPEGFIKHRSIIDPNRPEYEGALSEQDYLARYTDTQVTSFMFDETDGRVHKPLGIEITQNSYAWSYEYAEDFILFDYTIRNMGTEPLYAAYIGLYVDGDVGTYQPGTEVQPPFFYSEDIIGFVPTHKTEYGGCEWEDTLHLAWYADNDADFQSLSDTTVPLRNIMGVRLIRTPSDDLRVSFNWWSSNGDHTLDYGPQTRYRQRDYGRAGRPRTGTPSGDKNKYHLLSNGEFDFDQVFVKSIRPDDPIWVYPNQLLAHTYSAGGDSRYLLSFGPFTITPGQSLPLSFAYVRGDDFHQDPNNAPDNLINGYSPKRFMRNVHFEDIVKNSVWASWVYDNPGVDTDGDGYFGKYRLCCDDSALTSIDTSTRPYDTIWSVGSCREVYYEGDGVPDFRGAMPPPPPDFWIDSEVGKIRVRFNGTFSENTPDIFTQRIDFEGYRIYYALDERETSYSLLASYDREDYDKLSFLRESNSWLISDTPFTPRQLACLYSDSCEAGFYPLRYTRTYPFIKPGFPDSIFYFEPHENNLSQLGRTTPIKKVYPEQPYPSTFVLEDADPTELTDEGLLKYYEYEYTIENLLPTVQYYIAMTAFDFGAPPQLEALETKRSENAQRVYALPSANNVRQEGLEVYCYPNPYLINENYLDKGLEGRDLRNLDYYLPERSRRLHFANLPAKCTISIFSLDGDLIKRIFHDYNIDQPDASHETWNLLSRATMPVTTGIYYWVVESPGLPDQIGKFVIIK